MTRNPGPREYLGISLFWFALSFFWGAMLILVIPDRVEHLFGAARKDFVLAVVSSSGAVIAIATQILFGALSDRSRNRFGRRRPYLVAGTLATTVALFMFPAAHALFALLGAIFSIQFFLNVANGPYQALIPDLIPPARHGTAAAYMGVSSLLGRIGGPVVASLLIERPNGLWLLMAAFAVCLNAFMLTNLFVLHEVPYTGPQKTLPDTLRGMVRVSLRPYPGFTWLLISRFGILMGVYTVQFCLLYYVRDTLHQGANAIRVVTQFMIIATVAGVFATIPSGRLGDAGSKKKVLLVANSICICAGLAFVVANAVNLAYVAVAIFGAGYGVFSAVDWALACNLLPKVEPAKYMGVWGISDNMPQIIAPILAGPVAFVFNTHVLAGTGYRALMALSMVYFMLGTLALRPIKERTAAEVEAAE